MKPHAETSLDARDYPDKTAFLTAIARVLAFPPYFDANWDALEECLNDMSWHAGPIELTISHVRTLPPDTQAVLADVFAEAQVYWQQQGRTCRLTLHP